MRIHPIADLSSYENVCQAFWYQVPSRFARIISRLFDHGERDFQRFEKLFEELTGLYVAGADIRYQQTPPELFSFASLGCDGVHYGHVIHAPELNADDYPVGHICPMDPEGVALVGTSSAAAVECLATAAMEDDPDKAQRILDLAHDLGFHPVPGVTSIPYGQVNPYVPDRWMYVPSADGVGVLAPRTTFSPRPIDLWIPQDAVDQFISEANQAIVDGFPATALYYLREAFWHNWTDHRIATDLSTRMRACYDALQRPTLAEVVQWKVNRFFRA